MAANKALVPAGSQTVGPFFSIGLQDLIDHAPALQAGEDGCVGIHGQVRDANGAGVPDAMVEFWSPAAGRQDKTDAATGYPIGFRRVGTDQDGNFSAVVQRPTPTAGQDGRVQAPYLMVLVFSRGLLRHLLTRVYFSGDPANAADPLLQAVPEGRRGTLVAQAEGSAAFRWNVILQGQNETVFFQW